jgi:hypothetical protein
MLAGTMEALTNPDTFASFNDTDWRLRLVRDMRSFERLESRSCIESYLDNRLSDRSDVVLVLRPDTPNSSSAFRPSTNADISLDWYSNSLLWRCDLVLGCGAGALVAADAGNWTIWVNPSLNATVDHCLSRAERGGCKLLIHPVFLAVVVACNAFKLLCMGLTLWNQKAPTLMTIGGKLPLHISAAHVPERIAAVGSHNCRWHLNLFRVSRFHHTRSVSAI